MDTTLSSYRRLKQLSGVTKKLSTTIGQLCNKKQHWFLQPVPAKSSTPRQPRFPLNSDFNPHPIQLIGFSHWAINWLGLESAEELNQTFMWQAIRDRPPLDEKTKLPMTARHVFDTLRQSLADLRQNSVIDDLVRSIETKGFLIFSVVGTGKTYLSMMLLWELFNRNPSARILILVPPLVIKQWGSTLKEFSPSLYDRCFVYNKTDRLHYAKLTQTYINRQRRLNQNTAGLIVLASQDIFTTNDDHMDVFLDIGIDHMFVDEAHVLKDFSVSNKSRSTGTSKRLQKLSSFIDRTERVIRIVLITGTPIQNSREDLDSYPCLLGADHESIRSLPSRELSKLIQIVGTKAPASNVDFVPSFKVQEVPMTEELVELTLALQCQFHKNNIPDALKYVMNRFSSSTDQDDLEDDSGLDTDEVEEDDDDPSPDSSDMDTGKRSLTPLLCAATGAGPFHWSATRLRHLFNIVTPPGPLLQAELKRVQAQPRKAALVFSPAALEPDLWLEISPWRFTSSDHLLRALTPKFYQAMTTYRDQHPGEVGIFFKRLVIDGFMLKLVYHHIFKDDPTRKELYIIDSSMPQDMRQGIVDILQPGDTVIMSIDLAVGLTIIRGSVGFNVSLTYKYVDEVQAVAREMRLGRQELFGRSDIVVTAWHFQLGRGYAVDDEGRTLLVHSADLHRNRRRLDKIDKIKELGPFFWNETILYRFFTDWERIRYQEKAQQPIALQIPLVLDSMMNDDESEDE